MCLEWEWAAWLLFGVVGKERGSLEDGWLQQDSLQRRQGEELEDGVACKD